MSNQEQSHVESALINSTEKIYFFGLVLYLLLSLQFETQWDYGSTIRWIIKMLALSLLIIQAILTFPQYKEPIEKLVFVALLSVTCIVGMNAGSIKGENYLYNLSIVFLLVFGAKNIEFRKIVKTYLIVGGGYCLITVLSSLLGIIPNLTDVSMRSEDTIGAVDNINRMSFGYGWSTNMANHVLFIVLAYFYWVNRIFNKKEFFLLFVITIIVLYYTGSRLSTFCILMILFFSLLYKTKRGESILTNKLLSGMLIWCIPFFAFLSYYVTNAFDETDFNWMIANIILSGRLRLGQEAFDIAGIPLWGQFYEMFSSARADGDVYNYLDNSFVQSLVIDGLIYTVLLVIAYMFICRQAYRRKDFYLMYSVFFAGVSGLIAQHFIEMYMNPFLIALFAKHTVTQGVNGDT